MNNVRRNSIKKTSIAAPRVRSVRQPSTLQEMGDTNFGSLDASKDGLFVTFNNETNNFELLSADDLLLRAVEDNDVADQFIDVLESEIDLGSTSLTDIDGGPF